MNLHHPHAAIGNDEASAQLPALLAAQGKPDPSGRRGAGGRLGAFHAGGRSLGRSAGQTRLFHTGLESAEPSLGIAPDGYIYTDAYARERTGPAAKNVLTVLRTKTGASFQDVGPIVAGKSGHQYSQDPYLYVDPSTGRIFHNDLTFPCQQTSLSDDGGTSWTDAVANCDQGDHQNIFAGPAPGGPARRSGYPNVVYDCAINAGAFTGSSSNVTSCDKSLDGGMTFLPTGGFPFATDPAKNIPPGICDGATGHGFVDQSGRIYLPRGWCGQPYLAMSSDEGNSWTRVQVATTGMNAGGELPGPPLVDHEAAVSVDSNGNIYYCWVAHDYKPYLAISRDEGKHWSTPLMIAPPGVGQAALPAMAIPPQATPGHLAFAFMGSTDAPSNPYPHDAHRYGNTTWGGYIVETTTALDRDPTFYGGPFNDVRDPLVRGICAPVRCQAEYDFIDIQISRTGQPWAVLVDACPAKGDCAETGEGVLGTVVGGPKLGVARRRP